MTPTRPHPTRLRWLVLAVATLLALLVAVVAPQARAAITPPTNAYFVAGGTAPVKGLNVTGYAGKSVLVSLSTDVGTLKIDGPCLSTYIKPAFGYKTEGAELLFSGPYECVRQVLNGLTLTTPAPAQKVTKPGVATTPVKIKAMATEYRADLTYFPKSEHFYKYVAGKINGTDALAAGAASTELGLAGYLVSITDAAENDFVSSKIEGAAGSAVANVWIGAQDTDVEGEWRWKGGPDNGVQFWNGCNTENGGGPFEGRYSSWADGEPNNWGSGLTACPTSPVTPENCAVTNKFIPVGADGAGFFPGKWNDISCGSDTIQGQPIGGYIVEYGNKATGGDFQNVDLTDKTISRQLPVTNVTKPNVLADLFKTLFVSKKAKKLPKQKNKPATFTVTLKVKMNEAGTYSVTVKRPDGKGIPFAYQPGSTYKAASSKKQTATTERWNIIINTKKDNETVTVTPILKNADWVKPKDTKLFFRLVASKKDQENQMCMANWCQGATIPVIKG